MRLNRQEHPRVACSRHFTAAPRKAECTSVRKPSLVHAGVPATIDLQIRNSPCVLFRKAPLQPLNVRPFAAPLPQTSKRVQLSSSDCNQLSSPDIFDDLAASPDIDLDSSPPWNRTATSFGRGRLTPAAGRLRHNRFERLAEGTRNHENKNAKLLPDEAALRLDSARNVTGGPGSGSGPRGHFRSHS